MKFREFLVELSGKIEYDVVKSTKTAFRTKQTINGRVIQFDAYIETDEDNGNVIAEVDFKERKPDDDRVTFKATGSGGEMQVMSMVCNSMKEMIQRYTPMRIDFSSDDEGTKRTKVYEMALKKYFPEYDVEIDRGPSTAHFTLILK